MTDEVKTQLLDNIIIRMDEEQTNLALTVQKQLTALLTDVDGAVDGFQHDMSTNASRGRTRALAQKVRKVGVKIENGKKLLTADWKAKAKAVDTVAKGARDHLRGTWERARQPLTDWEHVEEQLKIAMEDVIKMIDNIGTVFTKDGKMINLAQMQSRYKDLNSIVIDDATFSDRDCEFRATQAKDSGLALLFQAIDNEQKRIAQEKELEELRTEKAERDRLDEERRMKEAEEQRQRDDEREAEETRISEIQGRITALRSYGIVEFGSRNLTLEELNQNLSMINSTTIDDSFAEFRLDATNALEEATVSMVSAIEEKKIEISKEEKAKVLKEAQEKREQEERENEIREEAAEKAKAEQIEKQEQKTARKLREQAKREANEKHVAKIKEEAAACLHVEFEDRIENDVIKSIIEFIASGGVAHISMKV